MKKYNLLYIIDENSKFDANTKVLEECFTSVTKVKTNDEALKVLENNTYDVILHDLSIEPEKVGILKKVKDDNKEQIVFALVDPKDTKKLYNIADMGVNAFELVPEQFDQALEMISQFDPSEHR
jgi:DNA-binding NtrC family response regulator